LARIGAISAGNLPVLMRSSLVASIAAACLLLGVPAASATPRDRTPQDPVGGPLLAADGVVVSPDPGAPALPGGLGMGSWLVADADTGAVLAAKAPHRRFLPASTLKTLTAVTLLPLLDPTTTTKATQADAAVDGSKVGLVPGMSYPLDTLFTAMLVVSGNDAADALAEAAGGIPHTVDLMNAEALHLQAFDTFARTPSGLDAPGETTSAYDLALIGRAGLALPDFRHYVSIVRSTVPAPHHKHFEIYTHNRLLTTFPGDIGIKNGYTVKAGATYVGAATRNGHTIIVTLMNARPDFWPQAKALLSWGFRARGLVEPVGTLVGPAVAATEQRQVRARPVVAVGDTHHKDALFGGEVPPWEVIVLASSAAVLVVVSTRRLRRRGSRLSLPPL
jgi:D-alanyl-D-alanine carboxypeptidase (penicillin-binding protein 5/6)